MKLSLEVLCATMNREDFSLVKEMNIKSNVFFANQDGRYMYEEQMLANGKKARMLTTNTLGASANRNISLLHSCGDICLLSDDDVIYDDDYENIIIENFEENPTADMIIFNLRTNSKERKMEEIKIKKKMSRFCRNPYGAVRVAFRRKSQQKFNCWFSMMLGPNALYKMGEDSKFINEFREKGSVYLSDDYIGEVNFNSSSWFEGYNEEYFFNKGAYLQITKQNNVFTYIYYGLRTKSNIPLLSRFKLLLDGAFCAAKCISYGEYKEKML